MRKDERIEQRNNQRNNYKKINLAEELEKHSLSLRKKKIDSMLMAKRTLNYTSISDYEIELNKLNLSLEEMTQINKLTETRYDVKAIWCYLFNNDLSKMKVGLFLLNQYIISEFQKEKEVDLFLSRNDLAVVNLLSSLLIHTDIQVKYQAAKCLLNLTSFPKKVQQFIYTEENLNFIYQGLTSSDFTQLILMVDIVRNCCVHNPKNQLYFYKQGILNAFLIVLKNERTTQELKLKIMRCVAIISQSAKKDSENSSIVSVSSFKEIIIELKPFLLMKDASPQHYSFAFILLLSLTFYSNELFPYLITHDFVSELIHLYYTVLPQYQYHILQIVCSLLSSTDSDIQILIQCGVIDLLKQALSSYKYQCRGIVNEIMFGVSNLFAGNLGQCEQAEKSGILLDLMEIGKTAFNEMKNQSLYKDNYQLFGEFLYAICNGIDGGFNQLKSELCTYDNGLFLSMITYGLGEYKNNPTTIYMLLTTIRSLYLLEENEMIDFPVKAIFLKNDIEGKLNEVLASEKNERNVELIELCISIFKDV